MDGWTVDGGLSYLAVPESSHIMSKSCQESPQKASNLTSSFHREETDPGGEMASMTLLRGSREQLGSELGSAAPMPGPAVHSGCWGTSLSGVNYRSQVTGTSSIPWTCLLQRQASQAHPLVKAPSLGLHSFFLGPPFLLPWAPSCCILKIFIVGGFA